jgi:hypothetical protein
VTRQLTLDGREVAPVAPRGGCIGKVQTAIDDEPWRTSIQIGKSIGEKPASVTGALHTLQQEGRAIRVRGMGPSRGSVWASPEAAARRDGIDRMHELHKARGLVAGEIDWRPTETMPEDYYAL